MRSEKGCVGAMRSPAARVLRHGSFRRGHDQLAVAAIEHKDVAGFGRHVDRRHDTLRGLRLREAGLGRHVHVPQIMVDVLK